MKHLLNPIIIIFSFSRNNNILIIIIIKNSLLEFQPFLRYHTNYIL